MPTAADLRKLARSRLQEAKILLKANRPDAAAYLCGYAVEVALKARICTTLGWKYPPRPNYQTFYTHLLSVLLHLSGRERTIKGKRLGSHWDNVSSWDPEARYHPAGTTTPADARGMIDSARVLLRHL